MLSNTRQHRHGLGNAQVLVNISKPLSSVPPYAVYFELPSIASLPWEPITMMVFIPDNEQRTAPDSRGPRVDRDQ
jgi:hypothetical protein